MTIGLYSYQYWDRSN